MNSWRASLTALIVVLVVLLFGTGILKAGINIGQGRLWFDFTVPIGETVSAQAPVRSTTVDPYKISNVGNGVAIIPLMVPLMVGDSQAKAIRDAVEAVGKSNEILGVALTTATPKGMSWTYNDSVIFVVHSKK